jgi:hemolysin III
MSAPRWISTAVYLLMGWLCVVAVFPLIKNLQTGALFWLLVGGIFYSTGAVIYGLKRPRLWPNVFGFHELFHIFIMFGTGSHFIVMYRYVSQFS